MVSGAVSAVSGVVTTLLMAAHLGSVWLQIAAGHTAQARVRADRVARTRVCDFCSRPALCIVSRAIGTRRASCAEAYARRRHRRSGSDVTSRSLSDSGGRDGAASDVEYRDSPGESHQPGA